jgi:hypothetical protein
MNRIIASAGIIAVGTASLCAADRPLKLSAELRGFYDDNYATAPSSANPQGSAGIDVRPRIAYEVNTDALKASLAYEYGLKYYFDRPGSDTDQSHQVDLALEHRFSNRARIEVNDSFAYANEPELISPTFAGTPIRSDSSAYRNYFKVDLTGTVTEQVSVQPGYRMNWYDYLDPNPGGYGALLDRFEHLFHLDMQYQVRNDTMAYLGYQYGIFDYTSDLLLSNGQPADSRNNNSHYFYVGAKHQLNSKVVLEGKVGAQYSTWESNTYDDQWSPYLDVSGTYTFVPGSRLKLGVTCQQQATDILAANQTATMFYTSLEHRITPRITGQVNAQYQLGTYNGGTFDGESDNYFLAGLNLQYKINQWLSAIVGYNFDRLDSDISSRSFTRNRVFGGIQARY